MKITNPRTYIELRVGHHSIVELILQIHRSHMSWFNQSNSLDQAAAADDLSTSNTVTVHVAGVFPILLRIIETSILPRMFADEIETNYYASIGRCIPYPKELGPSGIPVLLPVPSATMKSNSTSDAIVTTNNSKKQRRRRAVMTKAKLAEMKRIEQELLRKQQQQQNNERRNDIRYATDNDSRVQVAYRLEQLPSYGYSTTFVFDNENHRMHKSSSMYTDTNDKNHRLVPVKKLQRRIILWCYPLPMDASSSNDTTANAANKTTVSDIFKWDRPEMLPITLPISPS